MNTSIRKKNGLPFLFWVPLSPFSLYDQGFDKTYKNENIYEIFETGTYLLFKLEGGSNFC